LVDCRKRNVVAIFSYREASNLPVGATVGVSGADFSAGIVSALMPKISDKADEGYAVPFPQTERRELYAIIEPTVENERTAGADSSSCQVGKWVTVTRGGGIVPSMSVTWRKVENLLAFRSARVKHEAAEARERGEAVARLIRRFRTDSDRAYDWAGSDDWPKGPSNLALR
jgi:hypothetical protein